MLTKSSLWATATPTAAKLPISDADGKLDAGWVRYNYAPVTTVSADTLLDASHCVVLVGVAATITLPTAAGIAGRLYSVVRTGTGDVAVDLGGGASLTLTSQGDSVAYVSDGAGWVRTNLSTQSSAGTVTRADIGDASTAGRALMAVSTPSEASVPVISSAGAVTTAPLSSLGGFARDHGTVADEAAMLALHTLDGTTLLAEPRFVAPGDSCLRADDPGWRWHCIAGHGQALSDWERRPLGGALTGLAVSGHTHAIDDVADLVAALAAKAATGHGHSLADLTQSGATTGQVPVWDGSQWLPQTPAGGGTTADIKAGLEVWLDCAADNAPVDLHAGRSCEWVGTPAGATGKIGRAFSFNGANQVNVLNYPTLQKKARSGWTCCAWIKASAGACYWAGANGDPALAARSWYGYINSGGATCQYAFSSSGSNWPHTVNAPCALNEWVFLAVVCDPLNLSWIGYGHNGLAVRATLASTPNENVLALANNLYCGFAEGSAALLVDGFAYWRRPLRAEELAHLHNDGAGRAYASL